MRKLLNILELRIEVSFLQLQKTYCIYACAFILLRMKIKRARMAFYADNFEYVWAQELLAEESDQYEKLEEEFRGWAAGKRMFEDCLKYSLAFVKI